MKSRLALVSVLVAAAGCSSSDSGGGEVPLGDRSVTVLFTSDEHSHLFSFSPELDDFPTMTAAGAGKLHGGVARRATVFARERDAALKAGRPSVTVSAGDNQMGSLPHAAFTSASVDYGLMKALGYDVTTFGNHEFDFGPKALAASINAAKAGSGLPPIVASNVHFSGAAGDVDLAKLYSTAAGDDAPVHAYRVITATNGVRIGFIGWVGVNAEHVAPNKTPTAFSARGDKKEGTLDVILPKLYADLQPVVDKLHAEEHVDLVIGLSHGGVPTSVEGPAEGGEDYKVAANVHGIDLIVSGHAHNTESKPIKVASGGRETLVLNGGRFGEFVGRVVFTVHGDGSAPTWDAATQALLPVDDAVTPDAARVAALPELLASIEKATFAGQAPFLPGLLARATGMTVTGTKPGDLYFHGIGKTDFDVADTRSMVFLSADAMLASADEWGKQSGKKTDMGLESAGVIRALLAKGKTGVISAVDAFDVVPLGSSPVDGTLGYPLVRANLSLLELTAVFEFALALGPKTSDFRINAAGVKVEYDATRPLVQSLGDLANASKGQLMRLTLASDHTKGFETFDKVIYDRAQKIGQLSDLYSVVTSSYMAQFAADVGASMKDDTGMKLTLADAILHRADKSEIKHAEAFLAYLNKVGTLPALYNASSPDATKRVVCTAGCK